MKTTDMRWVLLALLTLLGLQSNAANFEARCDPLPDGREALCSIILSGRIETGDTERMRQILREPPSNGFLYGELVLNSPGGSVEEALKLAELVKAALLATRNYQSVKRLGAIGTEGPAFVCVSACALVLMAGVERGFSPLRGGKLGLHRPYFSPEGYAGSDSRVIAQRQTELNQRVRKYLQAEGMSEDLIQRMMTRSSKEVYWVQFDEWMRIENPAAWYEEMLIARCNLDPTSDRRGVLAAMQGNKELADKALQETKRVTQCMHVLRNEAQQRLRSSKSK